MIMSFIAVSWPMLMEKHLIRGLIDNTSEAHVA